MSHYIAIFLVGAHRFEVPFPKLQTFSEIFWTLHIDYSQYEKTILGIFVYLFTKLQQQKNIFISRNSAVKPQHVLCFLALIFLYTLGKSSGKIL